ncbi:MAG: transglutaminase-like domain-containing protein [Verrucomicrobiae bacterium]|nr:transglutaminase-like domain-containing protein [Verrucomicrobiae bacterium]NNJ42349.1 hypothetical protein [Akkermansiaceae bacterium]
MATVSDLPYLIRLLDDQDPAVRPVVRAQISKFGGDISHDLAALGVDINLPSKQRLSKLLAPGRRETLRDEWLIPSGGAMALEDDWESFENILRQISDFLHDGITLRPSLPDRLDLLADEIREGDVCPTANDLRRWMFVRGPFKGARKSADASQHYDLCRVMDTHRGNPTSLGCLLMLMGRRLGAQVDGCNYPGHFLARIQVDGRVQLVDCFHGGRCFDVDALLDAHPEISERARASVYASSHLGVVLLGCVTEIQRSLAAENRAEDAALFKELATTLQLG